MTILLAFSLLLASTPEPRLARNTIVENARYASPNGRFTLVMRQIHSVPDFGGRRADRVFRFSMKERSIPAGPSWIFTDPHRGYFAAGPAFPAAKAALYDGRKRVALLDLDWRWRGGQARIADSGRYVVLVPDGPYNNERTPVVAIYRPDGSRRILYSEDILTAGDRSELLPYSLIPTIRENDESRRDLLLLTLPQSADAIRIDLATGERIGPLRDLIPPPRTWASAAARPHFTTADVACADGDAVPMDSSQLVALAIDAPVPEYPRAAKMARQQGVVAVEVVVSENGEVLCARAGAGPFGLSQAAEAAAKRWRFTPYLVNGRAVKARGEIAFHFARGGASP